VANEWWSHAVRFSFIHSLHREDELDYSLWGILPRKGIMMRGDGEKRALYEYFDEFLEKGEGVYY
jgi:hypothetical protein